MEQVVTGIGIVMGLGVMASIAWLGWGVAYLIDRKFATKRCSVKKWKRIAMLAMGYLLVYVIVWVYVNYWTVDVSKYNLTVPTI